MKLLALFPSVAVLGSNKEIDIIGQLKIGWVQLHPSDGPIRRRYALLLIICDSSRSTNKN